VPNEFGLQRPSANGRPAPTKKASFASAKADARRIAPEEADFNRREGLRPTVGLRRPRKPFASAKADARRAAPEEADFNRREGLRPTVGLRRPRKPFASAKADAWRAAP
jgi:hypothetical protein